jgi:glycogen synthase
MHALVTADTIGGVWTYVRELVTCLANRGVRVTLVSFGEIPTARQTAWMDGLAGLDYRPTGFRLEWMQDAEADIEMSSEYLTSIVSEVRPDVLHLNQYCYGSLPVDVPRIVVAHSDVVSWWAAVHGQEPDDSHWTKWYRETVLRGLQGATAVVAPSLWMLDSIRRYYIHPACSSVIHNGRNPNLFNPHIAKDEYIVSVGRLWDAAKQVNLLKQIDSPVPILIAGSEEHPESRTRAYEENATIRRKGVRLKGQQSEAQLVHLYARAAMYVATSQYEPFGLAPLEAALSRCAIVANDIPTFHEIWGDDAYYFRFNDAASLQRSIEQLSADKELRMEYANRVYARARQHYSAERMAGDYLQLYQSVVAAEAAAA